MDEFSCTNAYLSAYRLGILEEVMKEAKIERRRKKRGYWTDKLIQEEAKKYTTRGEFSVKSGTAYNYAIQRGILTKVCSHMQVIKNKWTPEIVSVEAKKFKTRISFHNGNNKAYHAAIRLGVMDDVCSHMVREYNKIK